jgi:TRAP-type C4-dicarboxylate transport system substrate-binding protein
VRAPADLAGLSTRVQENPVQRETWAKAVSIPVLADVVAAPRDGKLDGQNTSLWVMPFMHIEEVQHVADVTGCTDG